MVAKLYSCLAFIILTINGCNNSMAQGEWPKAVTSAKGDLIKLYQPQAESFNGDLLKVRTAVSVIRKGKTDPVFGSIWINAGMETNRTTRIVTLRKVSVTNVRFPGVTDSNAIAALKQLLEKEIPKWNISVPLDQLLSSVEDQQEFKYGEKLNTAPPRIIYKNKPSMLVLIDGTPQFKESKELGVETVINTAFIIAKVKNGKLYLLGAGRWYQSNSIEGSWEVASSLPKPIKKANKIIKEKQAAEKEASDSVSKVIPDILISTEPAEMIQSNGEADLSPINGTGLLYVANTNDDIFLAIQTQHYFVLLSGRWYTASGLQGPWTFVASDKLPEDFSKIPEGSAKDNVLASVAGTVAARDAVLDAQIPQTARVNRQQAGTKVTYDGEPVFEQIAGTTMQHAKNTASTVLLAGGKYYCVDNGVWFESSSTNGPWTVATSRPNEVEKIPPESPAYNVKYVYIYDVTPEYVYMGYTPGYVGAYVYGPTVVYGTGMYYNPWYGSYYYPRPVTYGFSMHYNPYTGWGVGFHLSAGWFNMNIYSGGYHGGYWGPPMYRPAYYHPPHYPHHHRPPVYPPAGYRPPTPGNYSSNSRPGTRPTTVQNSISNSPNRGNLYNNHTGVTTNDRTRPSGRQPGINNQLPSGGRTNENLLTDRQGNVYKKDKSGWTQRQNNDWQQVNNNKKAEINSLDKQQQMRDRGNVRTNEFNQYNQPARRSASRPATPNRPSGGRRR